MIRLRRAGLVGRCLFSPRLDGLRGAERRSPLQERRQRQGPPRQARQGREAADREGDPVRLRRHAPRPGGALLRAPASCRPSRTSGGTGSRARTASSRASRRTPASVGTRSRPAPGRVSTAPRTTPSTARRRLQQHARASPRPASSRPTRSSRRPSGPARKWSRWSGSPRAASSLRSRARWSTSARSSAVAGSSSTSTCPGSRPWRTASACSTSARRSRTRRAGRTCRRRSATARQTTFTHANAQIPGGGVWDVYIYDSTNNSRVDYNRVLIVNSADGKDGSKSVANLARGDWADAKLTLASGALAGKTAGFYTKLIDLNADASRFRLYFTSVQRVNATYNALGPAGSDAFAETLARDFPTSTAADFAPLEALIVDEDTYVEQGLKWADAHFAYLRYIFDTLDYEPDVAFVGNPVTDEFSHQFLGLLTKTDMDGRPNPYYDDVNGDGTKDGRLDEREGYIQAAYHEADEHARARPLADGQEATRPSSPPPTTASRRSGWRSTPARSSSTRRCATPSTGLDVSLHPSGDPALAGLAQQLPCRSTLRTSRRRAGPAGRRRSTSTRPCRPGSPTRPVRTAAIKAFQGLTDPAGAGPRR